MAKKKKKPAKKKPAKKTPAKKTAAKKKPAKKRASSGATWPAVLATPPTQRIAVGGGHAALYELVMDDTHAVALGSVAEQGQNNACWGAWMRLDGDEARGLAFEPFSESCDLVLGGIVAIPGEDRGIELRELESDDDDPEILAEDTKFESVAALGGSFLAAGTGDGELWLWALDSREVLASVRPARSKLGIAEIAWHPTGEWLVTCSHMGHERVRLWSLATLQSTPRGKPAKPDSEYDAKGRPCFDACVSPDGSLVAVGTIDGTVLVFSVERCKLRLRHTLKPGEASVSALAFHPTQPHLVSGSTDGRLCVWNTDTGELVLMREPSDFVDLARPYEDEDEDEDARDYTEDLGVPAHIAGVRFARGGALLAIQRLYTLDLWDISA